MLYEFNACTKVMLTTVLYCAWVPYNAGVQIQYSAWVQHSTVQCPSAAQYSAWMQYSTVYYNISQYKTNTKKVIVMKVMKVKATEHYLSKQKDMIF